MSLASIEQQPAAQDGNPQLRTMLPWRIEESLLKETALGSVRQLRSQELWTNIIHRHPDLDIQDFLLFSLLDSLHG